MELDLSILKNASGVKLRKRYCVTLDDSPCSFDSNSFDCSFGFGRLGSTSFAMLSDRYRAAEVPGLYAIVIPAGGGKTTLAKFFKQLDVDKVLPPAFETELRKIRMSTFNSVSGGGTRASWLRHNSIWARYLSLSLGNFDFRETPRILFIHSHEIATVIGAKVVGILLPEEELHERWVSDRDHEAKALSYENREFLFRYAKSLPNMFIYGSSLDLYRLVSNIIVNTIGYAPGVSEYLNVSEIDMVMLKQGYDITIPTRIKVGKFDYDDLDSIIDWCKAERCPWWYVSVWCEKYSPGLIADGAYSLESYPWLHLCYSINTILRNRRVSCDISKAMVKTNLDWFGFFPHVDTLTESRAGVSLRSVFKYLDPVHIDEYLILMLNCHVGSHHSFVTSLVVYYLGVIQPMRAELRNKVLDCGMLLIPEEHWVSVHGDIHKLVRASQLFFGLSLKDREYASLQYTASLYGRRNYSLDPEAEIVKRQQTRLDTKCAQLHNGVNNEVYIEDFKAGVRLAYSRLGKRSKLRWNNFGEFYQQRYQWAAAGSVTNVPPSMRKFKEVTELLAEVRGQIVHLSMDSNKKRAMEKLSGPAELARYLSDNWAYNVTSLAPKPNEPAKNRVLMPGSFLHYVAMSYILGMVERTGDVGAVRVGDPDDNNLSHFDLRLTSGTYNFMLDFADHNAQHSSLEMGLIIALLEEKFANKSDASDLNFFINWVVDSFVNMQIRVGLDNHKVISGLFTGWRGTTWINSVACQAYVYVGTQACKRKYGSIEIEYFEGAGDDVLMKFNSAKDAFRFYGAMQACGFDMQSVKQMASHRRTEFLRTISSNGHLVCCVNRVLPNFICGDLERSSDGMVDRLGGCYATVKMLFRRGLSEHVTKVIYKSYLDKWARVKDGDVYRDIDRTYLHAPTEQGGIGLPDADDNLWYLDNPISLRTYKTRVVRGPNNASLDYARHLTTDLASKGLHVHEGRLLERLMSDVYSTENQVEIGDIVNVGSKVLALISPTTKVDKAILDEVLANVDDERVREYKKQWGLYNKYKQCISCVEESLEVLLDKLGINIDVVALEELRFASNHCFLVPEYLLYNIGTYYRSRVAFRMMSITEAQYYFNVACSTAKAAFGEDLML